LEHMGRIAFVYHRPRVVDEAIEPIARRATETPRRPDQMLRARQLLARLVAVGQHRADEQCDERLIDAHFLRSSRLTPYLRCSRHLSLVVSVRPAWPTPAARSRRIRRAIRFDRGGSQRLYQYDGERR